MCFKAHARLHAQWDQSLKVPQAAFGVAEGSGGAGETLMHTEQSVSSLAAAAALWEFGSSDRHGAEILGADTTQSSGPRTVQGLRDRGEQGQDPGKGSEWQSTEQQRLQAP